MTETAKNIIKSVSLYNANPATIYTLSTLKRLENGSAEFAIYSMTSQMVQIAIVCKFVADQFDGRNVIHLEEINSSGITADIAVDWTNSSLINETTKNYVIDPSAYKTINKAETQIVLLPSNIYIPDDTKPMQLFPKNLLKNRSKETSEFNSNWSGYTSCQKLGEDVVNLSHAESGADMAVELTMRDSISGKINSIGSKTVHVNPVSVSSPFTKKTMVIGDSFMDYPWYTSEIAGTKTGKGIISFLDALATADGNTLTFIGTHTSYTDDNKTYKSESYGGWQEDFFTDNSQHSYEGSNIYSPFCINGTANSYSAYFTALGEVPDLVIFFLGMNGNYSATKGESIQTMLNGIKAVNSNCKFIVCTIPPYYKNRYLYNYSYVNADIDKYNCNAKYLSLFDGKEDQGIYVSPIHAIFNAEYHYIQTESAWLNYSSEKANVVTNHHPNQIGVKVIADNIYSVICGAFAS